MGHIHKTESLYLLGAVFKISNDHPHPFIWVSSKETNKMIQLEIPSFKFYKFQLRRCKQ